MRTQKRNDERLRKRTPEEKREDAIIRRHYKRFNREAREVIRAGVDLQKWTPREYLDPAFARELVQAERRWNRAARNRALKRRRPSSS